MFSQTNWTILDGSGNNHAYNNVLIGHDQLSVSQIIYTATQLTNTGLTVSVMTDITTLEFMMFMLVGLVTQILLFKSFIINHPAISSHSGTAFTTFDPSGDKVYETRLPVVLNWGSSGFHTISLDQPFTWDGSSNIILTINKLQATTGSTTDLFTYTNGYTNQALTFFGEGHSDFDPVNGGADWAAGNLRDELPSIKMIGTCTILSTSC